MTAALQRAGGLTTVRRGAIGLAGLAVAALLVREFGGGAGELLDALARLAQASYLWIAVAVGCELLSYLAYASGQRRLLGAAGHRLGVGWLASLAVCAQAISNFLPAGYIAANLFNFRELARRDVPAPISTWLLVTSSALYIGALAGLTMVAGELAGSRATGGLQEARLGAAAVLVLILVASIVVARLLRRGRLRLPTEWRHRLSSVQVSRTTLAGTTALFIVGWLADAGCLVAALRAVGASPDWSLVPLAYCAAQLVSFLPVTPGGLGLVEGSLTLTLLAGGGGGAGSILAAVLLYRIISYWATVPAGVIGYWFVRRRRGLPVAPPAREQLAVGL